MRYTDPQMQKLYDRLTELGTPDALRKAGIFGAILDGFTAGYNGLKKPVYIGSRNVASTAYQAGKAERPKEGK
jgi:hypothetical protein